MLMQQPSSYYDNANTTLLHLVEPGARRILEFGCGAGGLARAVRHKLGPDVYYVGVELMAEQLHKAAEVLDRGFARNLDHLEQWSQDDDILSAMPQGSFDHVIFGDVLEHLYAPDKVLRHAVTYLKPGGSVLACIPNVQHWGVMAQILRGHWPQQDAGIFDRTHIRWFAVADMVRLLQGAGLSVEKIIPRSFADHRTPQALEFVKALAPAARVLGVDPSGLSTSAFAMQYVLCGRLKPAPADQGS